MRLLSKTNKVFAVLDFKTDFIAAAAASWRKKGNFELLDFCMVHSNAIPNGVVKDLDGATESIAEVITKFNRALKCHIKEVYVTAASPSVENISSGATLLLSKYGREINYGDITKCRKTGAIFKLPAGKKVLEERVREYAVDGEGGIHNPLGLTGVKLDIRLDNILINSSVIENLDKCVFGAGLTRSKAFYSGLANAKRVLTAEDMHDGVLFLMAHRGLMQVMLFSENLLKNCKVLPFGAEDMDRIVEDPGTLCLDKVVSLMQDFPDWKNVKKVAVLCEWGVDGVAEKIEKSINIPVVTALCINKPEENLPIERIAYTGCLGVLDILEQEQKGLLGDKNPVDKLITKAIDFFDSYF
ncbi:MAG: hypothetical protein HQL28_00510 [Candidatus Omnitrophica bacterium]|nr:hypothetical protein [Candidatus Omnitrophota bacterium]